MGEVVFIPPLQLKKKKKRSHIFSVKAPRRLVVLELEEEECKHLQTQWSLTMLYLRLIFISLTKLKAVIWRQVCCRLIREAVRVCVCVCVKEQM